MQGDLGSPLIMTITEKNNDRDNDEKKKYIVGVTLPRAEIDGTFLRFLKISNVLPYIQRIMDSLEPSGAINKLYSGIMSKNSSRSRTNSSNNRNKRPRL